MCVCVFMFAHGQGDMEKCLRTLEHDEIVPLLCSMLQISLQIFLHGEDGLMTNIYVVLNIYYFNEILFVNFILTLSIIALI